MKYLLVSLLILLCTQAFSQQGLQMDLFEVDSTEMELQRRMEYYQLITGDFSGENILVQNTLLPKLDWQAEYDKRYTLKLNLARFDALSFSSISTSNFNFTSPLFHSAEILSQAAYQLGDKLVVGGFSYGANSIFGAAPAIPNNSYFDTYGSTMFMQYKVSKNFKIETSISVGQRNGPPGF